MKYMPGRAGGALQSVERYLKLDLSYLLTGALWVTIAQIGTAGIGLALSIAYANFIDAAQYGTYRYILSFASLLLVFNLPGMNASYGRSVARGHEGDLRSVVSSKMRWGIVGSVMSLSIALYYAYMGDASLSISFFIAGLFIPFLDTFNVVDNLFHGRKKFQLATLYAIIEQAVASGVLLSVLWTHPTTPTLVLAYFSAWTVTRVLIFLWVMRRYPTNQKREVGTLSYGFNLSILNFIPTIVQQLDRVLIFQFLGPVSLAHYNFATIMPDQIKSYFKNIQGLALPRLSVSNHDHIKKGVAWKNYLMGVVLLGTVVCYVVLAPWLFTLLFPQYVGSTLYSQVYAISVLFTGAALSMFTLQATRKEAELYQYNILRAIAQIMFICTGLYFLGLWGLILARIASDLFTLVLGLVLVRRSL